jgi:DNA-binding CsgD family transcriptional regulator
MEFAPRKLHIKDGLTATPMQIDVLKLVVRGLSNKEIADKMNVSEVAVKAHLNKVMLHRICKIKKITSREKLIVFLYPWSLDATHINNNVVSVNG